MTYGHDTNAKWGGTIFGDCSPRIAKTWRVDSSIRICPSPSFSVDSAVGRANQGAVALVDSNVRATERVGFAVDAFNLRLPTDLYRLQETHPIILVELRLTASTLRVANRNVTVGGVPYNGRLVNAGAILRTITEGTDEVQLVLDDTDTRGPRFRDLFAVNAPESRGVSIWIGLTDDPNMVNNRIHLFEGKVERVPGFTRSTVALDVLRNEVIDDRLMGRLITLTDFPDAPAEVLGLVVPIVFGNVELSRGVVINTNAIGRLFFNHFIADTTIKLLDVSGFPEAGTLQVRDEQITWTGKNDTARELTGATRGANGTIPADHAKDTEVREVGPFVVKFHDGVSSRLTDIKILDPQGNLGEPVPGPDTIDHDLSTATWSELPRIRSAGVDALFQRVHFNAQEVGNLARNAQFAARENVGYDTFEYACVGPSTPLKIKTNTNDLGQPGDIRRVWIAVVHDAAPPSSAGDDVEDGSGFVEKTDGEVAQDVVFTNIFDFIPLPDGGFTNATTTAQRVKDSIDIDGVNPVNAVFDEMVRSVHGIPNGYSPIFATGTAGVVDQAIRDQNAASAAHASAVASATLAASVASSANIAAGATVTFPGKGAPAFRLVAQDLTPIEIARFDDRTNDRLYDVEVQIEEVTAEVKVVIPRVQIIKAGIWSNAPKVIDRHNLLTTQRENAESIFDGDDDTTGDATFNIPGEVNAGDGPGLAARAKFMEGFEEPASSGFKVVRAYLRVWVDTVTLLGYVYAPLTAYIEGVAGSEVRCRHYNALPGETEPTIPTGCILAPKEFRSDTPPHGQADELDAVAAFGDRLQKLARMVLVLEPGGPFAGPGSPVNCLNTWVAHTCDLIVELEKEPPKPLVIEDRKGITNHFEMTEFVDGDWDFFADPLRGGSITIESAAGELRVLEAFWVVEYQPFFDVSSSVPEVFADVTGKAPTGNPADIAESIVTSAPPQGMGLDAATHIAREDYNPARESFDDDNVRADFTITTQVNTLALLTELASQCDFRQAWTRGRHRIVRKPALGALLRANGIIKLFPGDAVVAFRELDNASVLRDTLGFSRTALDDTRTRFQVKFKPLPHTEDSGGAVEVINDAAELQFGRREEARDLTLIRDAATAELVTARDLIRRSSPRWLAEFSLPLSGLELALGDPVSLDHLDFAFTFGEVLDVSVETIELDGGPFITVKIRLIVWEK